VELTQAQDTLERSRTLASSKTISNVALTEAETAVQMAEIEVRSAQVELDRRTVRAPFSGVAGLTDVVPGNLVTTSAEIVRIEDVSTIKVGFEVPERWTGRIVPGLPISATAEGVPGRDFAGEVTAVDSRVDETTRTLRMEATLGNEDGLIKPGMAIVVRIEFDNQEQLSVPSLALQWDRRGSFVWRFADDTVTRVPVTVLSRRSGAVVVKAELEPGDAVVVEGVQRLREGAKATLVGEAPAQTGVGDGAPASTVEPAVSRTDTPPARS
jgi:RND family efflux transporter MFP subunit